MLFLANVEYLMCVQAVPILELFHDKGRAHFLFHCTPRLSSCGVTIISKLKCYVIGRKTMCYGVGLA